MKHSLLFNPLNIGGQMLANRIFMAPLTRLRATSAGNIPSPLAAEYYAQRAAAGLIITEATQVSAQAKGYDGAPGLYTDAQQAAWKEIADTVHQAGGKIAVQLWHTGLVSHQSLQPQQDAPISASAVQIVGARTSLRDENGHPLRTECTLPRAATLTEIRQVIDDFAAASARARAAGFDFVEIHGAHGYLLSQFWAEHTNHRGDAYGGSRENRARLMLEVLEAAVGSWDSAHVGIRISPFGSFNGVEMGENAEDQLWLISEIHARRAAYLHVSEPDWAGGKPFSDDFRRAVREAFPDIIIGAGAYDAAKAERMMGEKWIDAAAFGRSYIANPDLVQRIGADAPLNTMNPNTVYGGGKEGYTDYPTYSETSS